MNARVALYLPASGVTVHRIAGDGTLGAQVKQSKTLDYGIYPHQVMIAPSGRTVLLVDRGNSAAHGKAEDPGALRTFDPTGKTQYWMGVVGLD